ncbi:MAG TPA: transcription termination/antitermination protein NusG [Lentisphaeria bacterium]|nr:MAG: transcription termination/antitermination factor NusG [Lentisphaerae bacterium GWF2_49_21]HBC87939.1 transcription termination/antitermination protein NusG [Lentisphaeria bacterium]
MSEQKPGQWFVVHTLSGHENKVKEKIEKHMAKGEARNVFEVLVPMEKISEVRQGKKTTMSRKYFPGYILVRMDLFNPETKKIDEDSWYFVREIQGVIGFIGSGNKPIPLSPSEVDDLMRQVTETEAKVTPKINYDVGETVKIKDGAFENFEGVIEEIDQERGKLKLLVSIFGRSTPVELEYWQVERE